MINVSRREEAPTSLETEEIQQYIEDISDYLSNPQGGPKPSPPANYRNSDLLEAFSVDFHAKCYLTELKFKNASIMDVEHFISKTERPDLRYSWENLFPADHYSNMLKPRMTPEGGYLDPSNPNDDVESQIIYTLSIYGFDPGFEARDKNCVKTTNTCNLLNRIHNGHDERTIKGTDNLRHSIHKKYVTILNKIIEWQQAEEGSQEKGQKGRELRDLLSRRSSFTMLVRSMPAVRLSIPGEFLD
ncbi:hypothetical protein [Flagellimonas marinaquae]|uniref:hypothetical protein n=1 Tax=Flagellimonas marinaquae TaxID=254955 RepID=UPI00207528E1|nr:hypothetical protein [Allomuricauda aquimarina]USD26602.1 hypothetical protein MJO53_06800 [Allomuricauda aquimarina]